MSIRVHPSIVLLTSTFWRDRDKRGIFPPDLAGAGIERWDIANLNQTSELSSFRATYRWKWGRRDPREGFAWAQRSFERWYILLEFMRRSRKTVVAFGDSDVVMLMPLTRSLLHGRDALLCVPNQSHASLHWVAWTGTSILTVDVVKEWVSFTNALYAQPDGAPGVEVLHGKRTQRPFVSDMTLWYLFLLAANALPPEVGAEPSAIGTARLLPHALPVLRVAAWRAHRRRAMA